ncbi:MAG: NAD-dependent succinate-semialdehyde dehydrogenase, partial [Micromonosporaceae bacterium]
MPGTTLVGGVWDDPADRRTVTAPADGSVVGSVGYGDAALAGSAADAAAAAASEWAETPPAVRAATLVRAATALADRADEIGRPLAAETGKRLPEAVGEVGFAAAYLRWFGEQARRPSGEVLEPDQPGRRQITFRRPAGVVASLTPWNFPVSIQARKLAPALAAGCTVVARASEKAPLAVVELVRCLHQAGLPDGVLNLVHGPASKLTDALLDHPAVRVVSFTGSTEVGRRVMELSSRRIVRPLLELGGDAPFIVFDDADLDAAVDGAMLAKFRNNGQSCMAANRFYVHSAVYDEFAGRFAAKVDAMTVGDGLADPTPDLGPLIDNSRVEAVRDLVAEAVDAGAKPLTAAKPVPDGGSYAAPVLLGDVPEGVGLSCQEVFGPVAGVFRFDTEAEVIARANATEMGLAAYFFTRDASRVWRVGEALEAGIVGVNTGLPSAPHAPMGGVKQSGLGREGADLGLEEFQ